MLISKEKRVRYRQLLRYLLSFVQIPMVERKSNNDNKNSVVFSLKNQIGGLARALQVFQVYLTRRSERKRNNFIEFIILFKKTNISYKNINWFFLKKEDAWWKYFTFSRWILSRRIWGWMWFTSSHGSLCAAARSTRSSSMSNAIRKGWNSWRECWAEKLPRLI